MNKTCGGCDMSSTKIIADLYNTGNTDLAMSFLQVAKMKVDKYKKIVIASNLQDLGNFIINVRPIFNKLKQKAKISLEEKKTLEFFYQEARVQLPGIRNFADNIRPIFEKEAKTKKDLEDYEKKNLINFYLEVIAQFQKAIEF